MNPFEPSIGFFPSQSNLKRPPSLLFLFGLIFFSFSLAGQPAKPFLEGIILDYAHMVPIEDVNVINFSNGYGTTSNYLGRFQIPFQEGDTLLLSAVGYGREWFSLNSRLLASGPEVRFFLDQDTIYLQEVLVINRNYEQFKRQILAMSDIVDTISLFVPGIPRRVMGPPGEPTIMNPVSLIYNLFGKKARDQRRLDRYRRIYQEKYNQ